MVETMKAIRLALDALPERMGLAVWLHSCMGFSLEETAETLSIPWNLAQGLIEHGTSRLIGSLIGQRVVPDGRSVIDALARLSPGPAPEHLLARVVRDLAATPNARGSRSLSRNGARGPFHFCRTGRQKMGRFDCRHGPAGDTNACG